ncbi:helix-turn-helix domain-containing protein [Gracilibacillus dipsosauri]|uniref:helix-turn-helix domain-containing protein n=1 Tax=Gracilibacillus dipsosauri TaxID=178340 RepID=UPI002409B716
MNADVGLLLRKMRMKRGFTQPQLAKRLGLSASTVSRMEKGRIGVQVQDLLNWVKTTNGQELLIAFLCNADVITAGMLQGILSFISLF